MPELRQAMFAHIDVDVLDRERVSAVALRLINLGWFRVGNERSLPGGSRVFRYRWDDRIWKLTSKRLND